MLFKDQPGLRHSPLHRVGTFEDVAFIRGAGQSDDTLVGGNSYETLFDAASFPLLVLSVEGW